MSNVNYYAGGARPGGGLYLPVVAVRQRISGGLRGPPSYPGAAQAGTGALPHWAGGPPFEGFTCLKMGRPPVMPVKPEADPVFGLAGGARILIPIKAARRTRTAEPP